MYHQKPFCKRCLNKWNEGNALSSKQCSQSVICWMMMKIKFHDEH
jgi:uncharacterized protein YeaC (DUF1315 family)